jgi:hypothetical protein
LKARRRAFIFIPMSTEQKEPKPVEVPRVTVEELSASVDRSHFQQITDHLVAKAKAFLSDPDTLAALIALSLSADKLRFSEDPDTYRRVISDIEGLLSVSKESAQTLLSEHFSAWFGDSIAVAAAIYVQMHGQDTKALEESLAKIKNGILDK